MPRTDAVDGFRLAYDDHPGDAARPSCCCTAGRATAHDYRDVVAAARRPLPASWSRTCAASGSPSERPARRPTAFGGDGQARSVLAPGRASSASGRPSWPATTSAAAPPRPRPRPRPDLVRALVLAPPLPGAGERVLGAGAAARVLVPALPPAAAGRAAARRLAPGACAPTWSTSGRTGRAPATCPTPPSSTASPTPTPARARSPRRSTGTAPAPGTVAMALQEKPPAPADRIAAPTTVLWPEHDPLFPREWSRPAGRLVRRRAGAPARRRRALHAAGGAGGVRGGGARARRRVTAGLSTPDLLAGRRGSAQASNCAIQWW